MAEAIAKACGLDAFSAGTVPAERLNPAVVEVMKERDITMPGKPKMLTPEMIEDADLIVTMGCSLQDACPAPTFRRMSKKLVEWQIEDPKGKTIAQIREIGTQIDKHVRELLKAQESAIQVNTTDSYGIHIVSADEAELPQVLTLLRECELPTDGLAEHLRTAFVASHRGRVIGCSALELYGDCALLRSVAVKVSMRERGLGARLTKAALDLARNRQVSTVYLLTETASSYFSRFGFGTVPRFDLPPAVQKSVEFTSACPESATAMAVRL